MACLALENEAQCLPFLLIQFTTGQPLQYFLRQLVARCLIQAMIFILFDGKAFVNQADHCTINNCLAKFLNQVKHEAWFTRSISMKKPAIRVETCENKSLFHLRVEDTIAII